MVRFVEMVIGSMIVVRCHQFEVVWFVEVLRVVMMMRCYQFEVVRFVELLLVVEASLFNLKLQTPLLV